jgi:Mrp family chromosome partitioning ATPase
LGGALFFGLFVGLGVAFVRDSSSDRLGLSGNLLNTGVYPTLAMIPRGLLRQRKLTSGQVGTAISISDPSSAAAEAYSSLRNLLLLSTNDLSQKTLLVTSSRSDEGSETVAANLAAVLAKTGYSVLLVDASKQPSTLNQELGMTAEHSAGEGLISGGGRIETPTRPVRDVSGLRFVRLERTSPEGADAPGWDELRNTFAQWKSSFQYVVLYAPPLLEASDALLFAKWVDTVILSSRYNQTTLRTLTMSRRLLDTVRAHVAGIVVNDVPQAVLLSAN